MRAACPGIALGRDIYAPRITALLYADDLFVLAENQRDLQRALDAIGAWGARWRFSFGIGPEKTAVLVGGSRSRDSRFSFQGLDGPVAAEYCYLGVVFQASRKWNKHTDRLVGKGNRKFHQSIAGQKTAVCIQVFAAVCFVHTKTAQTSQIRIFRKPPGGSLAKAWVSAETAASEGGTWRETKPGYPPPPLPTAPHVLGL